MSRHSSRLCPRFQIAINLVGKRWNGLVLQVLLMGPARFGELLERIEVVGDRILSERLKELEAEGVVERRVVPTHPVRVEYELTEKGRALAPVVEALSKWAEQWVEVPDGMADAESCVKDEPAPEPKVRARGKKAVA